MPEEEQSSQQPLASPPAKGDVPDFNAWQLAWELGYTIAIPIVALALLGRWLDKTLNTSPWLMLVGIVLSVFISTAAVYKKVSKIIK